MLKRLSSLLLLLAVGAGVASGAPLHSGGRECAMEDSMTMMDCCQRARSLDDAPAVRAARLCCAVNCQGNQTSGASSEAKVSEPPVAPSHPAATQSAAPLTIPHERRRVRPAHADESPPVYLLNLAFLI